MPERQEGGADAWIKPDASAGEAAVELSMAFPGSVASGSHGWFLRLYGLP